MTKNLRDASKGNNFVSKWQGYFFLGSATLFCALDLSVVYYYKILFSSPVSFVIAVLFILLALHGKFFQKSDLAYVIFLNAVLLIPPLSHNIAYAALGTTIIVISWIVENWVWQGLLLYASTSAVLLIRAEDITLTLIFLCLQFAVSLIVGLLMRQQRDYTALLQGYLDSSGLAAEQIRSQLRRELAAQLHDTTAKDLAQISLAAQKLRDDPSSVTSEALAELASAASAAAKRIRPMILNLDISRESISLEKALVESRKMLTARGITLDVVVPKGTDRLLTRQQQLVASLVVRESASNILKYAPENSLASLELSLDEARNLSVYSQNRVAERPDTSFTGGYGLRNLEDKITSEGGELLFGKSGDKWNLSVEIPFRKEKPGDR